MNPGQDEAVVCEACGRSFADEWFWQEHWEDYHLGTEDDPDA